MNFVVKDVNYLLKLTSECRNLSIKNLTELHLRLRAVIRLTETIVTLNTIFK